MTKMPTGSPNFPWPEYKTYNVPTDTDHDGIPDDWERRAGLDPNDPNDANETSTMAIRISKDILDGSSANFPTLRNQNYEDSI